MPWLVARVGGAFVAIVIGYHASNWIWNMFGAPGIAVGALALWGVVGWSVVGPAMDDFGRNFVAERMERRKRG